MQKKLIEGYLAYTSAEEYAGAATDAPGTLPTETFPTVGHSTVWPSTSFISLSVQTGA